MLVVFPRLAMASSGVLMVVKGDIQVTSAKDKATRKAKFGDKVAQGDTITAGVDSRAKVVMSDKNVLNISPSSKILIEKYVGGEGDATKNVSLSVVYGKLRATVNQKYDGEKSKFHVKTPTAVVGVRGTDFVTSHSVATNTSKIVTFEGQVAVGSSVSASGQIANPVMVNPGEFTVASTSAPPTAPAPVPAGEMQQMKAETQADGANGASSDAGGKGDAKGGDKEARKEGDSNGEAKADSKSEAGGSDDKGSPKPKSEAKDDAKTDSGGGSHKSDSGGKSSGGSKEAAAPGPGGGGPSGPKGGNSASAGTSNGAADAPSGGSTSAGPKGAGPGPGPGSPVEGPGGAMGGGSRAPASVGGSMGPAGSDLNATAPVPGAGMGAAPVFAPPPIQVPIEVACPSCGLMDQRPPTIPDDTLRNVTGSTKLIINMTGP